MPLVSRLMPVPQLLTRNKHSLWPSGYRVGLAINRLRVRFPATSLPRATMGELFAHTHMCQLSLLPSVGW